MKKIVSLILCLTMLMCMCTVAGCGKTQKSKENLTGKEIAQMLLANARLNSEDLSMKVLDSMTSPESTVSAKSSSMHKLGNSVINRATSTSGNTVSWSDFSDECNAYDFFSSYFVLIEDSAKGFAELIDEVKANCKTPGYWTEGYGIGKVLLTVEDNQETIYVRDNDGYKVCRRYTNEDADDVYEMYTRYDDGHYEARMLYIAGKRYEYSSDDNSMGLYIVGENTRGYWNMFQILDIGENRCNIMNMVSTNSMAFTFDASMMPELIQAEVDSLSFSTVGLTNDIVRVGNGDIEMNLGAFNGISHLESNSSNVESFEGSNALTYPEGVLVTTSGKKLTVSNESQNDKVSIRGMYASFTENFYGIGNHRTSGKVKLRVAGDDCSEMMANFKTFLAENDMSCKYDLDYIISKYSAAQEIAKNFRNVYKWNGYSIKDYSGIKEAVNVERSAYSEFAAMYDAVKDIKTVEMTEYGTSFKDWDFSKIDSAQCGSVTMSDNQITVNNMNVTVNDTAIFDQKEKYTVRLALAKFVDGSESDYDNAVIMDCEGADLTEFTGSAITLNQSATYTLPRCASEGKYTVVAYVATEDGIRVSEMIPVIFSEDVEAADNYDGLKIDYKTNEKHELRIDCSISIDVYIKPEDVNAESTYDQLYESFRQSVSENGYFIAEAEVELYDEATDTGTVLGSDADITNGIYRMRYSKQVGNSDLNGYVYYIIE